MIEGMSMHQVRGGWWQVRYQKRKSNCRGYQECWKVIGLAEWIQNGRQGNRPRGSDTLEAKARWLLEGCGHE